MAAPVSHFYGNAQAPLDRGFLLWVAALTLACLWPIWWYRFLPMQDHPQHLFIAYVLSTFDSHGFDWPQNYELNPNWGAYTLTYGILRFFSAFTNIEAAGKLLISLYVLLMSAVVLRGARHHAHMQQPPWALLLIFAFVFNQTYFLGFQSYLLSIPFLFFALMDLMDFELRPITLRSVLYQFGTLTLLFLTHPFSVLTYLVFGFVLALFHYSNRAMFLKTLAPLVLVTLIFIIWYLMSSTSANGPKYDWQVWWWSLESVAIFYFIMFTGMRWTNGIDFYALTLWISIFGLLFFFIVRDWKHLRISKPLVVLLALTLFGYLTLPYWMGYYAFFNLRLAPVTYLLLAWILASVSLSRAAGHFYAALVAGLIALSINTHANINTETAQLLPILAKMEKNSAVLPILLDSRTAVIDPDIFYQLHAHDHYYFHILVGGGVNPLAFPNPMLPIRLRQDRPWPAPEALEQLSPYHWQRVISQYRYVLLRTHALQPIEQLSRFATIVGRSGPWTLLETGNPALPQPANPE